MRSMLARYAGTVAVAVIAGSCSPSMQDGRQDVLVNIVCTARRVNVNINGWVIHKSPGNSIGIRFTHGGSGITTLTLTPKDAGRWDFTPPPQNGSYTLQANNLFTLTMDTGATGTYRYTLTGQCTTDSATDSFTIDPDIVVD